MKSTLPIDMPTATTRRQPIRRGTASQQLHASLRQRIVELDLKPGAAISRSEIATEYGVSLTPVRDALIKLEEEGLVVTFPQSKTEVSRIDIGHAQETHFLRLSVELEIVRRLATGKGSGQASGGAPRARPLLAQQVAARDAGSLDGFADLDRAFHFALYEAAGVATLYDVVDARSGHIDRLRNLNLPDPGKTQSILDYHGQILDAIEAGDPDAACAALRGHLSGTLSMTDQIRDRHPEFF